MSYRIKMAAEVAGWLAKLREADPDTIGPVDEALVAPRGLSRIRYERDQGSA
jgi:hypothetical protein